jgi:hypothetical protein
MRRVEHLRAQTHKKRVQAMTGQKSGDTERGRLIAVVSRLETIMRFLEVDGRRREGGLPQYE